MESSKQKHGLRCGRSCLIVAAFILAAVGYGTKLYLDRRFQSEAALLAQSLGLKPGMVVADVGAGDGKWTVAMAARVGAQGRVFSTEIAPNRLDDIRRAAVAAKLTNVTVVQGAAEASNLPDNCCDAIFLRNVYHHFKRPDEMNQSLWRALRPGGRLAVIDFAPRSWLWFSRPTDVPANRGGHGIPRAIIIDELAAADFLVERIVTPWPDRWTPGSYCLLFRKPTQILFTMRRATLPGVIN